MFLVLLLQAANHWESMGLFEPQHVNAALKLNCHTISYNHVRTCQGNGVPVGLFRQSLGPVKAFDFMNWDDCWSIKHHGGLSSMDLGTYPTFSPIHSEKMNHINPTNYNLYNIYIYTCYTLVLYPNMSNPINFHQHHFFNVNTTVREIQVQVPYTWTCCARISPWTGP